VVGASGTEPLEYQWYKDGQQIAGAIETIYRIASVSQSDLGIYSAWVQNKAGRSYSQIAELSLAVLHTLTVASRDPDSGVTVTVSPVDNNGQAGSTTQFTRVYYKGTEVTLSAKQSVGSNEFKQWLANGVPVSTEPTVTVTMDYDRTLRAVYELKHEPIELKYPITTISPFTFTFSTVEGVTYEVQVTQDLKNWSKLGEVKGTSGEVEFTDPCLPKVPYKRNYFRVKLVE
jgi:hypothetical protein